MSQYVHDVDALRYLLAEADHVDIKQFEADLTLRQFAAGMFNYYPSWIKALYRIRWGFVRLLGMKQSGIPDSPNLSPEDLPMEAGAMAGFFKVEAAKESEYWIASAKEKHLDAFLGLVVEPLAGATKRFHVVTIVNYQHWTGPVYFNVIRPFHHLVVRKMGQAAVRPVQASIVGAA